MRTLIHKNEPELKVQRASHTGFFTMGTRCHIVLPGIFQDHADILFRHIQNEFSRIENMLSIFLPHSEVSEINRKAADMPVKVSGEICGILNDCRYYHKITGGSFDITLRPVSRYLKENTDADVSAISEMLPLLGTDKILINRSKKTVSFRNREMEIDPGGFGKGYALEKAGEMLLSYGVERAFISVGESSVLTIGSHPAADCWRVGIRDYTDPENAVHTFDMRYGSLSTSANFFMNDKGNIIHHGHVIDPGTGKPFDRPVTSSVCSGSPMLAEVLSTAVLVMPDEKVRMLIKKFPDIIIVKVNYENGKPEKTVWESGNNTIIKTDT